MVSPCTLFSINLIYLFIFKNPIPFIKKSSSSKNSRGLLTELVQELYELACCFESEFLF